MEVNIHGGAATHGRSSLTMSDALEERLQAQARRAKQQLQELDAMLQQRLAAHGQQMDLPQTPQLQEDSQEIDSRRYSDQSRAERASIIHSTLHPASAQVAASKASKPDKQLRSSVLLSQLHPRLRALLLLPTKEQDLGQDLPDDDALEEDDITKFVEKHKKKVQGPKALQTFVSACRARYAHKCFMRYLMVRRKHVHRTLAQYLDAWMEYAAAVTYQDRYLKRRCLQEWAEYSKLKMLLCEKVIGLFKSRMANAGSFLSPFQLPDADAVFADDSSLFAPSSTLDTPRSSKMQLQSGKIMTVTSVVASLLQRAKPFHLQQRVMAAWRKTIVEKKKQKIQAVMSLVHFNSQALWSKVHDAFRFWFRWALSRVASRQNIDLPLFRPQLVCWDAWLASHKRSVDLNLKSQKLHRGFRLRHCMYWWYTYTQRIAAMRLAWYRAGLHPEVLLLREAFMAFKVNKMNASIERQGMRRVLHYWHLIAAYLHHMRSMKYTLELVVHRQRKAYTFRKWMVYTRAMQVMVTAGIVKMQQCYSQAIFYMFAMRGNTESMYFMLCWRSWVKWVQGRMQLKTALGAHHARKSRLLMELSFMGWRKVARCMVQAAEDALDIDHDLLVDLDHLDGAAEAEAEGEGAAEDADDGEYFTTLSDFPMRLPWRPTGSWTQVMLIKRSKKAPGQLALHSMCDNMLNLEGPYTGGATGSALSMEECLLRVWHRRPPTRNQVAWVRHGQGLKAWQKSRNKDPWWWQRIVGLILQKNPPPLGFRALLPNKAEHLPLMPILQARYTKLKEEGIINAWLPPTLSHPPRNGSTILAQRQRIPQRYDDGAARSIAWMKAMGPQIQQESNTAANTDISLPLDTPAAVRTQPVSSVMAPERVSASGILARLEQAQGLHDDNSFLRTVSGMPEGDDDIRDDVSHVSDETSVSNASSWWQMEEEEGMFDWLAYDDLLFYHQLTEAEAFLDFVVHVKMGLGAEGTHHLNPILMEKLSPRIHFKKVSVLHGDVLRELLGPAVQHDCKVAHTVLQWMLNRERSVYGAALLHEQAQALSRHRPGFTLSVRLDDLCARWQTIWDNCPPDSDEEDDIILQSPSARNKLGWTLNNPTSLSFTGQSRMMLDVGMPLPQYPLTAPDSDSGEDEVEGELSLRFASKHGLLNPSFSQPMDTHAVPSGYHPVPPGDHSVPQGDAVRMGQAVQHAGGSPVQSPSTNNQHLQHSAMNSMGSSRTTTTSYNHESVSMQASNINGLLHTPTQKLVASMSFEPSPRLHMVQDWIAEQANSAMTLGSPVSSSRPSSGHMTPGRRGLEEVTSAQENHIHRSEHTTSSTSSLKLQVPSLSQTTAAQSAQPSSPTPNSPLAKVAADKKLSRMLRNPNEPPASHSFMFHLPGTAAAAAATATAAAAAVAVQQSEEEAPSASARPAQPQGSTPSSTSRAWQDYVSPDMPDVYDIVMRYATSPSPAGSVRGINRQGSVEVLLEQLDEILHEDMGMFQKSAILAKAAVEHLSRMSQDDVPALRPDRSVTRTAGGRRYSALLKRERTGIITPSAQSSSVSNARAEETLASVMKQIEEMLKTRLPPTPPNTKQTGLDLPEHLSSMDHFEASVQSLKRQATAPSALPPTPPKHDFLKKGTGTFCHPGSKAQTQKRGDRVRWSTGNSPRPRYNPFGAVKSKVAKEIEEFAGRLKHCNRRLHSKRFLHSHKNVKLRLYRKKKKGERSAPSSVAASDVWESHDFGDGFDAAKLEELGCHGLDDWSALHGLLTQKASNNGRNAAVKKISKPAWNSYIPDITGPPKKRQKQSRAPPDPSRKTWFSAALKPATMLLPLIEPLPAAIEDEAEDGVDGGAQSASLPKLGMGMESSVRPEMADQSSSFGEWSFSPGATRRDFILPSISHQVQSEADIAQILSLSSKPKLSRHATLARQNTRKRSQAGSRAPSRQSNHSPTISLRHMPPIMSSSLSLPSESSHGTLAEEEDEHREVWQSPQAAEGIHGNPPSPEDMTQQIHNYLDTIAQEEWEQYAADANELLVQLAKVLHVDVESLRLATSPPADIMRPSTPGSASGSTVNKFSHAARQALAATSRRRAVQERPQSARLLPRRKSLGILPRIRVKQLQDALAKGLDAEDMTGGMDLVHCDDDMLQLVSQLVLKPCATRLLFLHQLHEARDLRQKVMDNQSLERQLHDLVWEPAIPARRTPPPGRGKLRSMMIRLSNNSSMQSPRRSLLNETYGEGSYTSVGTWAGSNNAPSVASSWSPVYSPLGHAELDLVRSERVPLQTRPPATTDKGVCEPPIYSNQSSPQASTSPGHYNDGAVIRSARTALAGVHASQPGPHHKADILTLDSRSPPVPQGRLLQQAQTLVHRRLGHLRHSKRRVGELEDMEWNDFSAYAYELDELAEVTVRMNAKKVDQWYKTQYTGGIHAAVLDSASEATPRLPRSQGALQPVLKTGGALPVHIHKPERGSSNGGMTSYYGTSIPDSDPSLRKVLSQHRILPHRQFKPSLAPAPLGHTQPPAPPKDGNPALLLHIHERAPIGVQATAPLIKPRPPPEKKVQYVSIDILTQKDLALSSTESSFSSMPGSFPRTRSFGPSSSSQPTRENSQLSRSTSVTSTDKDPAVVTPSLLLKTPRLLSTPLKLSQQLKGWSDSKANDDEFKEVFGSLLVTHRSVN